MLPLLSRIFPSLLSSLLHIVPHIMIIPKRTPAEQSAASYLYFVLGTFAMEYGLERDDSRSQHLCYILG